MTELTLATNTMCTSEDFSLSVWRLASPVSSENIVYKKVADLTLKTCRDFAYSFHIACCEFRVQEAGVLGGDVLGILHGLESSLLHEVDSDPPLRPLFGADPGSQTSISVSTKVDRNLISRRGYPLLAFESGENI